MAARDRLELLLLHALPLDGSMWARQMDLLPGATHAPTLYPFGDNIESWAVEALELAHGDCLIVVGCSAGGSCALEAAIAAPNRVAALVLIGTKTAHRADPAERRQKAAHRSSAPPTRPIRRAPRGSRQRSAQVSSSARDSASLGLSPPH
jgi:pimeloyl-ACP methyl ester carboxylesterase